MASKYPCKAEVKEDTDTPSLTLKNLLISAAGLHYVAEDPMTFNSILLAITAAPYVETKRGTGALSELYQRACDKEIPLRDAFGETLQTFENYRSKLEKAVPQSPILLKAGNFFGYTFIGVDAEARAPYVLGARGLLVELANSIRFADFCVNKEDIGSLTLEQKFEVKLNSKAFYDYLVDLKLTANYQL